MDFVKILRSFEEFLYEILTWLLFYPRTLWRVILHPLAMMDYSDREQHDPIEQKYTDALSPPLFLMLSILLAHMLELMVHQNVNFRDGFRSIFQTDQTFLLLRCVVFGLYPLMFAAAYLRQAGVALDRETLRAPFFAQCYVTAPFALTLSIASLGARMKDPLLTTGSSVLGACAIVWLLAVQTQWFRKRLGQGGIRAFFTAAALWTAMAMLISAVGAALIV